MKRLIIGCGYLGIQVARIWIRQGDHVFALTRDKNLFREHFSSQLDQKIELLQGDIVDPSTLPELPDANTLLFSVGMDRRRYHDVREVYVEGLKNILSRLKNEIGHFIYISSTGVYGQSADATAEFQPAGVDEQSPTHPTREGGKACLAAEDLLHQTFQQDSLAKFLSILRFAGIYGPNRIPLQAAVKARDWSKLSSQGFLNLIHVLDGARIINQISNLPPQAINPETLIVSDGSPVPRKDFYEEVARWMGTGPIEWETNQPDPTSATGAPGKIRGDKKLLNHRLKQRLNHFQLEFPDFRAGLANAICLDGQQPD